MSLLSFLFGCRHARYTFPLKGKGRVWPTGNYVCCLDCGKEFAYDWQEMRIVKKAQLVKKGIRKAAHEAGR